MSIVDETIDGELEFLLCLFDGGLNVLDTCHITGMDECVVVCEGMFAVRNELLQSIDSPGQQQEFVTLGRESDGTLSTDATACTGDDDEFG